MAAADKESSDTINSHISFLYNNISSNNSEETFEYRDDVEAPSLENQSQTSLRRSPLKKMLKGFKKLVRKKHHEDEDNEPLMRHSFSKSTQWVTVMKSGDNVIDDYSTSLKSGDNTIDDSQI